MSASVISADAAQRLNQKVQRLIDPRLFLCCNYEPTVHFAIDAQGQYLTGIQDLYKFALDSSCIIKNYKKFLDLGPGRSDFRELRDVLDCIDMLRAVTDHNQSELNGWLAKKRLSDYSVWVKEFLGKEQPNTQEDFSLLYEQLRRMAEELLAALDKFIEYLGSFPDNAELVDKWIDCTLKWYCNNTKTEIYKGQLMNAYIANTNANGKDYPQLYNARVLYWKISEWVGAAILYPVDQELKSVELEIQQDKDVLKGDTPVVKALRAKIPEEAFREMMAKFERRLAANESRQTELQARKESILKEVGRQPMNYFFKKLEQQLRETMSCLDDEKISYTLLPQDLLQEDIHRRFKSVPSPEKDF